MTISLNLNECDADAKLLKKKRTEGTERKRPPGWIKALQVSPR